MTAVSKSSSLGQMHAMMDIGAAAAIACTYRHVRLVKMAADSEHVDTVPGGQRRERGRRDEQARPSLRLRHRRGRLAFAHKLLAAASRAQTAYAAAEVSAEAQATRRQMLVQNRRRPPWRP